MVTWSTDEQSRYVAGSHTNLKLIMPSVASRLIAEANQFDRQLFPERFPNQVAKTVVASPLAAASLAGIGALAVASIAGSQKQIAKHELKRGRKVLTLFEAYPDMARKGQNNGKSNGKAVVVARKGNTSRMVLAPVSGGVVYTKPSVPRFNMRGDSTIIRNTESVQNISQAAAINVFGHACIPATASWLGNLADLYSKFRFLKLEVIYIPSCPTNTAGNVAMGLVYDRTDAAPGSVAALAQTYRSITFPTYAGYGGASALNGVRTAETIAMDLDTTKFDKMWYPTISAAAFNALTTKEQNYYCPASVWTVTSANPGPQTIGDLYWKYVIELIEPINAAMNL